MTSSRRLRPEAALRRRTEAPVATRRADAGDTLLELLLAIVVIGVAGVAILLAFTTSIIGSSNYRTVATNDTVLRTAAEQATSLIQSQPGTSWASCTDAQLASTQFTLPTGYAAKVAQVQYWNPATSAFTATCVPNTAQLVVVTVTHAGTSFSISVVLDDPQDRPAATTGAAAKLVFLGQPGSTIQGSPLSPPPIVAVEDTTGNIVTTDFSPVTIALTAGTGTAGATLASTCSGAEFYGVVTFSGCAVSAQGTGYTLTASDGLLTKAKSATFSILAPPASQLAFTVAPSGVQTPSTTATSGPYVVTEQDVNGNAIVATAPVTVSISTSSQGTPVGGAPFFSLTEGGAAGTAITTLTIPAGQSSTPAFYYADTAAGSPSLNGTNPTLLAATTSVTFPVSPPTRLGFTTTPPATVTPNATFPVVVAEEDTFGNPESSGSAALSLTASGGGFSCAASPSHLSSGVASYSGCSFTTASLLPDVVTATSFGLSPATATTNVGAGPPSKLVFTTAPPSTTSQGTAFGVTVAEEDALGNVELTDSGTSVSLGASGGGFACTTAPSTVTNGVASFSGCSFSTAGPTPYTVTASSGSLAPATATTRVVGPPVRLAYSTPPPAAAVAGATFGVTVTEQDASGNTETGDSSTALSLGASGGGAGFSCATVPTHVTAGTATFAGCSYTVATPSVTLTASSGVLTPATSSTAVSPGKATRLVYTTAPPSATSAGTLFSATVAEQDAYGNVETGDSTTAVILSAGGGFGCGTVPATLTSGAATFSGCAFTTANPSGYTVAATAPTLTSATVVSTVAAGTPARLVYTTAPPQNAKTAATFPVAVAEQDAFGNLDASDSTTALTLSANNGGGGFSCLTTPTHLTAGVASYTGCAYAVASTTPYTLSASSGSLTPATATMTVYGPAVRLVYTASPPGSAVAGSAFSVTVAEQDALGNVEVGDSTTALTLTSGGGFSCSGAPVHVTNGTATFSGCTFTKASASPFTVTATSGSLTPATSPTTVSPGAATKLVYTTAPPASTTAGTTFAITAVEEDAFGNVEVGDSTSPIALGASGGAFACAAAPGQLSNGVGAFSGCEFTHASPAAYTVSATSGALTSATAATVVSAGTPKQLVFTTAPPSSAAAGSTFGVTVAEQDAFGNLESADSATSLSLAANGGGGGFSCSTTPTHVTGGIATYAGCDYTVASGSAYTLSATSGSLSPATASTSVSPGTPAKLVYTTAPPASTTAGTTFTVAVAEQDFFGNLEAGDSSTVLSLSASGGGFSCGTAPTQLSSGTATYSGCAFVHAGTFTVTAASAQLSVTATTTVSHGPAHQLAFTTDPQSFERGASGATSGSGTITVQLQDQEGNPVPAPTGGMPVGLLTTSGTGSFAPTTPLTIAAGTSSASFVYHDATAGSPTLTATASGLAQPSTTQQETVLAGPTTATVAVGAPTPDPVSAGSATTVQVTVTNTSGSNADFSVAGVGGLPAGALAPVTSATCVEINAHGHTTGTFTLSVGTSASTPSGTSTLAVVVTQWASSHGTCSGGATGSDQGDGTLDVAGAATQLVVVQQPATTAHNAAIAPAVVVLVEDAGYDPVASGAQVTVALGANPDGAVLFGTLSVGAPAGSASFSNLRVSGAGTGDTLVFTSAGLASATTSTFTVT